MAKTSKSKSAKKDQPKASSQAIVVGAGIVGIASGLRLLERGIGVTVVDPREPGDGASYGNAGILASAAVVPVPTPGLPQKAPFYALDPKFPLFLKWRYLPKLAPWLISYLSNSKAERVEEISKHLVPIVAESEQEHRQLAAGTPAAQHLRKASYIFAYPNRQAFEAESYGWELRRRQGIELQDFAREAAPAEVQVLSQKYQHFAVLERDHGGVDKPGDYVKALAKTFVERGGEIIKAEVQDFLFDSSRLSGVRTSHGELRAEQVLLAAGAWSARLAAKLGIDIELESERGYHLEFRKAQPAWDGGVFGLTDGKCAAHFMGEDLRIAGMVEFGGLDSPPSRAAFDLLYKIARDAFPGLSYDSVHKWMGHRPATSDSLPVIGESQRVPGLFFAFGHQHVGLTAGPKTARLVADLMAGRKPNLDLYPYRAERFS